MRPMPIAPRSPHRGELPSDHGPMPDRRGPGGGTGAAGHSVSATTMATKLGIKPGQVVDLVAAPRGWSIPGLPAGARVVRRTSVAYASGLAADVTVAFCHHAAELERKAAPAARSLAATSALWVAWPRRAGGHKSDITDALVRATLLSVGVVDVKVAALDLDWSGLKFVWRLENRSTARSPQ